MYFDAKSKLCSIPASWTSLAEPDLFAQTAAGRSWFRVDDLLRLCAQIAERREHEAPVRAARSSGGPGLADRARPYDRP
jgi:hypothetical protein